MRDRAIAIVGMNCLFPKAPDVEQFWANIREGVDAVGAVPETHWSPDDYFDPDKSAPDRTYAQRGGFIDPVDFPPLEFGISPRDVEAIDTSQLLGMMVARRALEDAGYGEGGKSFDRDKASVVVGVTGTLEAVVPLGARLGHPLWREALAAAGVDEATAEDVVKRIGDGYVPWQENSFPGLLGNVVAGRIANRLDLRGTNCVVDAACASSLSALHTGIMELISGRADMVLSGGIDTFNDIFMYMCFSKTPALSPTGDARPFSADGDGTILGEGLGMLVLKRLEDAEQDGDRIYAVIRGLGTSSDGKGNAVYAPSASGQARCLNSAYRDADVDPGTIELLEAHGTGTMVGDATEIDGLNQVFREARADGTWCALGSVKSMIGHTKAAAGSAGLIKAAMALHERVLPPTIKISQPTSAAAPGTTPFYVNTHKRPWLPARGHPRRAGVSAFGFGGSNFHCVLEEYTGQEERVSWDGRTQILAFSGEGQAELDKALEGFDPGADWAAFRRAAAASRKTFDGSHECRLTIVVEQGGSPVESLIADARTTLTSRGIASGWSLPRGVFFGHGRAAGGLCALFPGQGAQAPGMLRDLACMFPEMRSTLADADTAAGDGPVRLSDIIHPHPAFDDATSKAQAAALRATDVAQPAMGAVSLGAWGILQRFGVDFDAAAGHSYGELVALCAAGRLADSDLHRLSQLRGRLMADGTGDRGAMLAVLADHDAVAGLLARHDLDLVVANRNAPRQMVLSGSTAEVDRAQALFSDLDLTVRRLDVAAAFHSELVAEAAKPFGNALSAVDLHQGELLVYSNTTGDAYPDDDHDARALLAGQLAEPVEFVPMIDALFASGVRTFVEVGPGRRLSGLVDEILDGEDVATLAIDASSGSRHGQADLARLLSALVVRGHNVGLDLWDEGLLDRPHDDTSGFTISLCGANHRSTQPSTTAPAGKAPGSSKPAPVVSAPKVEATPARAPAQPSASAAPAGPKPATVGRPPGTVQGSPSAPVSPSSTPGRPASGSVRPPSTHPVAVPASPVSAPAPVVLPDENSMSDLPVDPSLLTEALRASRDGLAALMQMQQQTAELHRRFLEGQERSAAVFQSLLQQQSSLASGGEWPQPMPAAPAAAALPSAPAQPALPAPAATPLAPVAPPPASVAAPSGSAPALQPAPAPAVAPRPGPKAAPIATPVSVPAPTHTATTQPASAAPGSEAVDHDAVAQVVLSVVSDKTGYPIDMLELSMGMDSDLGIDSIKRVEILSAIQDRLPEAPIVKPEHLGELKTLGQLARFLVPAGGSVSAVSSPAPALASAAAGVGHDRAVEVLLSVVSEKTGYPIDMLELSMGMDSDLGIDSIKRVEILSAIQEQLPDAPVVKPEHLGELKTLGQLADFLSAGLPAAAPIATVSPSGAVDHDRAVEVLLSVVSEKTGYPVDMLELSMGMDSDLGIDSIKRVEILSAIQEQLPDAPVVKPEHLGELKTLGQLADFLCAGADGGASAGGPSGAAAAATGAASPSTAPGAPAHDIVAEVLLSVVSEKTGYPVDMLELSMGMDSDLGIDSIKRVEILSAIQEQLPEAPVVKPQHLGELKTLGQLAAFLCSGDVAEASASGAAAHAEPAVESAAEQALPLDTYALELADLVVPQTSGNFLPSGGRLWVSATDDGLSTALAARWQTLGLVTEEVAIDGKDTPPDDLVGLVVVAPEGPCGSDLPLRAFDLVRRCGPTLRASAAAGGAALLMTVSRVDGRFGLGDVAGDPLSGCLSGLTKSAHHEWTDVTCRAFDVSPALADRAGVAEDIVAFALCAGPVEVALHADGPVTPELVPTEARESGGSAFDADDVVVISGGARGITAEIAVALATASSPRLVLLGRSALPGAEADWLSALEDEASVKAALVSRASSPLKPRDVQQQWRAIDAAREVRRNLARIEDAGSEVQYHAADVRDTDAVSRVLAGVRKEWGPITGLVHGAGVLADRTIDDKSDDDVRAVVSTKVEGLAALLAGVGADELKALALFSSTTARFGRRGQSDYAMANEALEKLARAEARRRPGCRVVSFGWGPWDGGMVDASLRRLFADEGIAVIPMALGAELLVNELAALDGPGEMIVLGGGSQITPRLETDRVETQGTLAGSVTTVTRELSVADHAFLAAHVLDGKAVLPVAVMIEWLGHAALHGNPGLRLVGLDGLAVFKGVLVDGDSRLPLSLRAQRAVKRGDGSFAVLVELISDAGADRTVVHASATAVLAARSPEAVTALPVPELKPFGKTVTEAYGEFLFHGALLQGIETVDGCGDTGIVATAKSASAPAEWMTRPLRSRWIAEPLAIDCAFQMLILWSLWKHDLGSLPTRFASYRQYRAAFPEEGVRIEVRVQQHDSQRVVADIDWLDSAGDVVARMVGYECVMASSLTEHFTRNTLTAPKVRP